MIKLLLIENDERLAANLHQSLTKENYEVTHTTDGAEGLLHGISGYYDIIILAIELPKKNGFEIIRELRIAKINIPILILSIRTSLNDKIQGFECGADDYLTKPFHLKELLVRLHALAKRFSLTEEHPLFFGDLKLDTARCTLYCSTSGQFISLSGKEFLILQYLLQNKNQILSREQLARRVWGLEYDAEYNTVEVYLSFVRKKISRIGSNVKIRAIRGLGYTLK